MDQDRVSPNRRKDTGSRDSMARLIGNILTTKRDKGRSGSSNTSVSAVDDNALYSREEDRSVAQTVSSQATVKASNRKMTKPPSKQMEKTASGKGGWKSLKRLVGVTTGSSMPRGHSKSEDFARAGNSKSAGKLWSAEDPLRQRFLSEDGPHSSSSARVRRKMDLAIRGRLDGIDCLSLGPVSKTTLSRATKRDDKRKAGLGSPSKASNILKLDPLKTSFTGASVSRKPANLVSDMIWSSGGKECPELIFEGFVPGGGDRWTVRLGKNMATTKPHGHNEKSHSTVQSRATVEAEEEDDTTAELTEDGSTNMPAHMLWDHIWGSQPSPPVPAFMQSASEEEEDVMQLVANCSVPVDLDEDTFIIDSPEHFRSVLDVAMVPLQSRRFDAAVSIFDKLLKGLEEQANDDFEHLQACTHHNVGIILMCQSNFERAMKRFQRAVEIRTRCLPQNHPDVAVSLMRQGEAFFALAKYKKALASFERALNMSPAEDATRAKMLNNIGVVLFQQGNFSEALTSFTSALEIQRQWLDGPVRREAIIYDASLTLGNMGKVFLELEDYDVAYSLFEEACLLQTTTFRKDHDVLLTSLENLSLTQFKSDDYDKAIPILRSLLRTKESRFGSDHRSSTETVGLLAFALIQDGDFEEASELLKRVSDWQKENMSPSHPAAKRINEAISTLTMLTDGI